MLELSRVPFFVSVVECLSFSSAAKRLGVSKSVVSEQVSRLERETGVKLINRTTRKLVLTPAGEALFKKCQQIMDIRQQAISSLGTGRKVLRGKLRVAASLDFGSTHLAPVIAAFSRNHPEVEVELILSDETTDRTTHGVDVTLRDGWLDKSSQKFIKIGSFEQWVVCSPEYIQKIGPIRNVDDLQRANCLILTVLDSSRRWSFTNRSGERKNVLIKGVLSSNSTPAILAWTKEGMGCAVLPDYVVIEQVRRGDLVRLLPSERLPECGIYVLFSDTKELPLRTRALVNYVKDAFKTNATTSTRK